MINILTGGSGSGGGLKLLAYLPFVKMKNNKAVGLSKRSNGSTDAEGTLYPSDLNTASNIGSLNSFASQMANYSLGTSDDETPGNNITKMLVGENYFNKYKRFKYAKVRIAKKWKQSISNISVDTNSIPHKFVELDSTRGVMFFKVAGTGYYAQVIQRDASTNVITMGTPVQLETNNNSTSPWYLDAVKINTDKILWIHSSTSNARVMTISGTTITLGTAVAFTAGADSEITIAYLDTDKAIITYNESSDGKARVITVSGTTITMNTVASMGENAKQCYVEPNTTTTAQVTYYVGTQQKTRVLSVSGTTVTPQTAATVGATGEHSTSKGLFRKIATDKFIFFPNGALTKGWVIGVSGTTSTATSSTLTITDQQSEYNGIIEVVAGTTYDLYRITDSNSNRKVKRISISGTAITDSNQKSITDDSESNGQILNIQQGTVWHWGTDIFLYAAGRSFGSHNGFYGYIGNVGSTTFELYNDATIIGSAKTVDYSFIEETYSIDSAITTGKKCYFGIKNTTASARYISLFELLVEVE